MNVRRINNRTHKPTDNQVLNHNISVIKKLERKTNGRWEFAICVANNGKVIAETTIISPRTLSSKASKNIIESYPLESIQIDPDTELYISDMTQ